MNLKKKLLAILSISNLFLIWNGIVLIGDDIIAYLTRNGFFDILNIEPSFVVYLILLIVTSIYMAINENAYIVHGRINGFGLIVLYFLLLFCGSLFIFINGSLPLKYYIHVLIASILVSITEELFFRKYIVDTLQKSEFVLYLVVMIPTMLFVIEHLVGIPYIMWDYILLKSFYMSLLGLALVLIYIITKDVKVCNVIHATQNVFSECTSVQPVFNWLYFLGIICCYTFVIKNWRSLYVKKQMQASEQNSCT